MPTNAQSLTPSRPAPQSSRARQLAAGLLDLFDPNVRRLGLLPYPQGSLSGQKGPVEWSNWVAPQLAVDMVKAIELPGRAWRGEQISPDDVTKMAMDTMGGSGLLSRAVPTGNVGGLLGINVFHGGPHRWASEPGFPQGRPRMDKMGTGEGAQAYGHGFYGGEAKGVGQQYKQDLSGFDELVLTTSKGKLRGEALDDVDLEVAKYLEFGEKDAGQFKHNTVYYAKKRAEQAGRDDVLKRLNEYGPDARKSYEKNFGTLYKLDIPDADAAKYLDWDAPLSEQPENVRKALKKWGNFPDNMKGSAIYEAISVFFLKQNRRNQPRNYFPRNLAEATAEALRKAGIPGLKYRDQMSRYDPDILPDNMIANEARKWLGQSDGDSEKAMKLFKDSNPRELYVDREINEIEKVISTVGRKITRNYVTWDQDVLDRTKILERD